jgi:cyclohexa-1,5-dienecarbonyl-CoA hydratase
VGVVELDEEGGALRRLVVNAGRGNILGSATIEALHAGARRAIDEPRCRCLLVEASGSDFSFGASVEEHLPGAVEAMLPGFHALLKTLLSSPVPVIAAVRGRCLGGGLEPILAAGRIVAHPSARFAAPEISLAVFAPASSALLPERVGQAAADELLLGGRSIDAEEARSIRLVDQLCGDGEDPGQVALGYARSSYLALSASTLRIAVRAAREAYVARVVERIDRLERLYLQELMRTADAVEGLQAFLEKLPPRWQAEARGEVG